MRRSGPQAVVSEPATLHSGRQSRESGGANPLVVDLDGTVLRTDLLVETATAFVARRPLQFFKPLWWLMREGKAGLKQRLAQAAAVDPRALPYNEEVLHWLRAQRASGRRIVLATASHDLVAQRVAGHLGLFDDVVATDGRRNIKGEAKREVLVKRYGEGGFDYVGDAHADLSVWSAAGQAWLVNPSPALEARARRDAQVAGVIRPFEPDRLATWARALRLHQWLKNLLVLIPLAAAHRISVLPQLASGLLAFLFFGLCASSVYLLNDLIDVSDDRRHRTKSRRPFASGRLSLLSGWIAAPLLLIAAFAGAALLLPASFVAALGAYYLLTLAYSFRLKRVMMLDVVTLALLYSTRLIAGGKAVDVPLSFWLLTFSMFIFMSLALMKRYTELIQAQGASADKTVQGRGYMAGDLNMVAALGAAAGYLAVMVLALYIQDPATAQLYTHPQRIWLACPLLLYWISRTWMIAHRGRMSDDPVIFALKDPVSMVVGVLFVGVFIVLAH